MRKAIIDIGTNSTKLLVADNEKGSWEKIISLLEFTRIGESIGKEQILKPEPLKRTAECIKNFIAIAQKENCAEISVSATSAIRDAQNRTEVCAFITKYCGKKVEVLSGEQEAYLSYLGAVGSFDEHTAVLDIGGGSSELAYSFKDKLFVNSVAVGAVRLKEHPEMLNNLEEALRALLPKEGKITKLVAVGGTATTLAALEQDMQEYNSDLVHKYPLSRESVAKWRTKLGKMSVEEIKALKIIPAKRADVIYYGVLILDTIMQLGKMPEVLVEDRDLMYGLLQQDENRPF